MAGFFVGNHFSRCHNFPNNAIQEERMSTEKLGGLQLHIRPNYDTHIIW
jgi:hypothetical protein